VKQLARRQLGQLLRAAPDDLGQRVVDGPEAAVEADDRHPDRGVLERRPEALLGLAPGAVGAALARDVARHDEHAGDLAALLAVRGDLYGEGLVLADAQLDMPVAAVERRAHGRLECRGVRRAGDLAHVPADHRGTVDAGALELLALEQQAAQLAVAETDRRAWHVAHDQAVQGLALGPGPFQCMPLPVRARSIGLPGRGLDGFRAEPDVRGGPVGPRSRVAAPTRRGAA
jgi:hypothetical protein